MANPFLELVDSPGFSEMARNLGYFGIFVWFVSLDQITPIPEEITLLTIGYLSANGTFNPVLAGAISLFSFLLVDSVYFFLSRSGNKFLKKISHKRHRPVVEKYKNKLKEHLPRTLIILCFIPRMRMFGPIFCGVLRIDYKRFILFDTIGLAVFTALYIMLGEIFGHSIQFSSFRNYIFGGSILILAIMIFYFFYRTKNHKNN
jgi:membrane-associated protein